MSGSKQIKSNILDPPEAWLRQLEVLLTLLRKWFFSLAEKGGAWLASLLVDALCRWKAESIPHIQAPPQNPQNGSKKHPST